MVVDMTDGGGERKVVARCACLQSAQGLCVKECVIARFLFHLEAVQGIVKHGMLPFLHHLGDRRLAPMLLPEQVLLRMVDSVLVLLLVRIRPNPHEHLVVHVQNEHVVRVQHVLVHFIARSLLRELEFSTGIAQPDRGRRVTHDASSSDQTHLQKKGKTLPAPSSYLPEQLLDVFRFLSNARCWLDLHLAPKCIPEPPLVSIALVCICLFVFLPKESVLNELSEGVILSLALPQSTIQVEQGGRGGRRIHYQWCRLALHRLDRPQCHERTRLLLPSQPQSSPCRSIDR